ncbi:hypothetical protein P7C73_g399, partial [Tremellales sp. Uapishka_1]
CIRDSPYPPPAAATGSRYTPVHPNPYNKPLYPGQPPPKDYPIYITPSYPPPTSYRNHDHHSAEPSRFNYQLPPRRSYDAEHYDPHQPSSNPYDPGASQLRLPPYPPPHRSEPFPPPSRVRTPPLRHPPTSSRVDEHDLTLLTQPATANVFGMTTAIYTLPTSHLPITKYVAVNKDDAIDLHTQTLRTRDLVWYADGSTRAGEGWSAAIEWIVNPGISGSKMRGCVGAGDALDAELGGIYKAVEGFQESLHHSIKTATPISHQLTVFCDSQAAIISIDTSTRPEAIKFCKLWRDICTEFLHAHLNLVWIPKNTDIQGNILADKIAVVGATNAYLKKKKQGVLPDIYVRPGGGECAPSGSSEAGSWQRGDADPSRRKTPFERPKPLPVTPPIPATNGLKLDFVSETEDGLQSITRSTHDEAKTSRGLDFTEHDATSPYRDGSLFVTQSVLLSQLVFERSSVFSFPDNTTAKDIGILFAQYGNITAVDIFSIAPGQPRFALVSYSDKASGITAINDLHRKIIRFDTPFAQHNLLDLQVWRNWGGALTVVQSDHGRMVPKSVADLFPHLPDWITSSIEETSGGTEKTEVEVNIKEERASSLVNERSRKRSREIGTNATVEAESTPRHSSVSSTLNSPSPRKRARPSDTANEDGGDTPSSAPAPVQNTYSPSQPTLSVQSGGGFGDGDPKPQISGRTASPVEEIRVNRFGNAPQPPPAGLPTLTTSGPLPPTPVTALGDTSSQYHQASHTKPSASESSSQPKSSLTNSAAVPLEMPIALGAHTLRSLIALVRTSLLKHDTQNWIAHSCVIAMSLDDARRALQSDLYLTDDAFLAGRDFEKTLAAKGFTDARVDAFIRKVLKVLDGIAMADELGEESSIGKGAEDVEELEKELARALERYPAQTKEAVKSAGTVMEYLVRGKELQEKKRVEVERRVKVLEGMVKVGEVVGGVVRFLLTESDK